MKFFAIFFVSVFSALSTQVHAYITPTQFYDPSRHILINTAKTGWDLLNPSTLEGLTASSDNKLQFIARSGDAGGPATLTMRIDQGEWPTARQYAERWLKDFPKFGYELQMSRETKIGDLTGYDMELKAKESRRIARQFIVKRPHEMWVFTCSGDDTKFSASWTACEKILKTVAVH
jgi:hypothetical protein